MIKDGSWCDFVLVNYIRECGGNDLEMEFIWWTSCWMALISSIEIGIERGGMVDTVINGKVVGGWKTSLHEAKEEKWNKTKKHLFVFYCEITENYKVLLSKKYKNST